MTFKAKYDGRCGECSEVIREGDLLEWEDGEVVHAGCHQYGGNPAMPARPTCSKCWQVPAANGECGCES